MLQQEKEPSYEAGEWIVCKDGEHKHDPRAATPYKMAIVGPSRNSFSKFNNELMKSGEVAYTRKSYGGYFAKRHNLDALPKVTY